MIEKNKKEKYAIFLKEGQSGQMILYNQTEIVQALLNPRIYPVSWHVKEVEMLQSHIAMLFLAGDYAFKLKRAVLSQGTDFSTPQKRRIACVREMRRSTIYAPHLVIGIRSVRRLPNGRITLGGKLGEEVDTLIIMKRLKKADILGFNIPDKAFDRFEIMDLAEQLADLHCKAKMFRTKWRLEDIQQIVFENERILSRFGSEIIDSGKLTELTRESLQYLAHNARLISLRQKSGHIRKCHGELLLSNIARKDGKYIFFSPVEHNTSLDCIDTLYDLSSLLMDFEMRGLRRLANMLFNHYLAYTNDMTGYPLLPLYQSIRAMMRAGICAKKVSLLDGKEKEAAIQNTQKYFDLACQFLLKSNKPVLIACGGLSGSGKSRLSRELGGKLCPAPGAVILCENIIKKQMSGCKLTQQLGEEYNSEAYKQVVYDVLNQQAKTALSIGSSVIVDGLFYHEADRITIEQIARELNVPFVGFWVTAPIDVRENRIQTRKRNPSDVLNKADLEKQQNTNIGNITWNLIDTDQPREQTLEQALAILKQQGVLING